VSARRASVRRASAWIAAALTLGAAAAPAALGAQQTHLLVVAGIGGEPQYTESFHRSALAIADAARRRFGVPDSNVVYLAEAAGQPGAAGASTKANVERELARLARRAGAGDELWIVLVGHGSGQGRAPRFNLPGPDMTAADFRRALAPLDKQKVAFVNAASASGDFATVLAAPNRAVVTATKSSAEANETLFAQHFAAALSGEGADTDKDGGVSLLEAFTFAKREVARVYEADNRLLTEHAQLADGGSLAATMVLAAGRTTAASPEGARLRAERAALDARLADLRGRKATMDSAAYERALEALLLEIARNGQAARAAGGRP